jgi:hypothetical protein
MNLGCAICLDVKNWDEEADDAVTIVSGTAVCEKHREVMSSIEPYASLVSRVREEEAAHRRWSRRDA